MTHTFNITGLTCSGCVAKAKSGLLKLGNITQADIQLQTPQATITMQKHIPLSALQEALGKTGKYTITEAEGSMQHTADIDKKSWLETYKPVLLIFAYVLGVTLLIEAAGGRFEWMAWMGNFMAGFFLVFSFFKLLNLRGFAQSYSMYDVIAKRWKGWGYLYPFAELGLGIAYLVRFNPLVTGIVTIVIMSVSIAGVLRSVFSKHNIQCACLGDVFNLPMSTVTIIEDGLMIAMSVAMTAALI